MEARTNQNIKMADSRSEFICLKNVDSSFQNRSNSVFDRLNSLEPANDNSSASIENETRRKKQEDANIKSRNISARSGGSKRLPARVPQHVLSPEKWTKYSLENDGTENLKGINEHSLNKYAARSFLADLKKRNAYKNSNKSLNCCENITTETRRNVQSDKVTANEQTLKTNVENDEVLRSEIDTKFLFKKPEPTIDMTSTTTGVWKDGTYIMPEYEVGSAKPKASPKQGNSLGKEPAGGKGLVILSHLGDEVEDGVTVDVQEGKKKGKRNFRKRKVDDETKDDCEKDTD